MLGQSKGFSLLEIIIVLAILAVLSLGVIPLLQRNRNDIDVFVARLNALVEYGRLQAQSTQKTQRILFDLQKNRVSLEGEIPSKNPGSQPDYKPAPSSYLASYFDIPSTIELRRFLIDGKDELTGLKTNKVWFFIAPDGSSQDILLDIGLADQEPHEVFELSPFKVQFKGVQ